MATESLAPSLLLAMPQMRDPNFEHSVVLLCEHSAEGTMGLVINRPTTTSVVSIVQLEDRENFNSDVPVWVGGPVDTARAWILSTDDPRTPERVQLVENLYLAASTDALRLCLEAPAPDATSRYRFLLGYAGWAPGQLEGELAASAWLNAPVDLDIVFQTPAEQMWDEAIRRLGVDPLLLHMGPGVH